MRYFNFLTSKNLTIAFAIAQFILGTSSAHADSNLPIEDAVKQQFVQSKIRHGLIRSVTLNDDRGLQPDGSIWWVSTISAGHDLARMFGPIDLFSHPSDSVPRRWLADRCQLDGGTLTLAMPYAHHSDISIVDPSSHAPLIISEHMLFRWGTVLTPSKVNFQDYSPRSQTRDNFGLFSCAAVNGSPIWHVAITPALNENLSPARAVNPHIPASMMSIRVVNAETVQKTLSYFEDENQQRRGSLLKFQNQQRADLKAVTERMRAFETNLAIGTETNCGMILDIKGPIVEVQVPSYVRLGNGQTRVFVHKDILDVPDGNRCRY